MAELAAEHLAGPGSDKRFLIAFADSGLDEIDDVGPTTLIECDSRGALSHRRFDGSSIGGHTPADELAGHKLTAAANAEIFQQLIRANLSGSRVRKIVCLNAGAALAVAGLADAIESGFAMASDLLNTGAVLAKYEECRRVYAGLA